MNNDFPILEGNRILFILVVNSDKDDCRSTVFKLTENESTLKAFETLRIRCLTASAQMRQLSEYSL